MPPLFISLCLTNIQREIEVVTLFFIQGFQKKMDDLDMYEEPDFDDETQARLDNQVDKLLKGYDWTLAPLANRL